MPMMYYDWMIALTDPSQTSSWSTRFFSSRPMQWLGNISMSVYLIREMVIRHLALAVDPTNENGEPWSTPGLGEPRMPAWGVLVALPLSVLLGSSFYSSFEKPMNAWLVDRIQVNPAKRPGSPVQV